MTMCPLSILVLLSLRKWPHLHPFLYVINHFAWRRFLCLFPFFHKFRFSHAVFFLFSLDIFLAPFFLRAFTHQLAWTFFIVEIATFTGAGNFYFLFVWVHQQWLEDFTTGCILTRVGNHCSCRCLGRRWAECPGRIQDDAGNSLILSMPCQKCVWSLTTRPHYGCATLVGAAFGCVSLLVSDSCLVYLEDGGLHHWLYLDQSGESMFLSLLSGSPMGRVSG